MHTYITIIEYIAAAEREDKEFIAKARAAHTVASHAISIITPPSPYESAITWREIAKEIMPLASTIMIIARLADDIGADCPECKH